MPNRTLYAKDEALWKRAADYARDNNMSLSAVVELALAEHIKRFMPDDRARNRNAMVKLLMRSKGYNKETAKRVADEILDKE